MNGTLCPVPYEQQVSSVLRPDCPSPATRHSSLILSALLPRHSSCLINTSAISVALPVHRFFHGSQKHGDVVRHQVERTGSDIGTRIIGSRVQPLPQTGGLDSPRSFSVGLRLRRAKDTATMGNTIELERGSIKSSFSECPFRVISAVRLPTIRRRVPEPYGRIVVITSAAVPRFTIPVTVGSTRRDETKVQETSSPRA